MSSAPSIWRPFSVEEIESATQNFDDALVIGEGGFGKVYKASITNVENGESFVVAIKRLDPMSSQGAPEFWAEVEMLTKLRHCNLVSLIGYCNDNSEMILVYEFMPHGTLCDHLRKHKHALTWVQRLKMSIGAARGLHYLHTGTGTQHGVIHRDVKTSNILLDKDYDAKISDFGLSKIGPTNTSGAYVNTLIRGTFGYLDPEYFLTGRLTRKSDVFAFGVVLFELLCGRPALDTSLDEDECSLVKWAHESIEKGKVQEIIDSNIKSQIFPKCLKVFVQIADRCLSSESKKRPTMAEILVALEHSLTLQNKFDNRAKPAASGMLSIARMIKWPFISPEVNSAPTSSKPATVNEVTIRHGSSSKEASVYHSLRASLSIGGEQVVAGWPAWLVAVAGEAIYEWLPRRADTFEKLEKIGQGMYSNVYMARDMLSNKIVALKKVRFDFTDVESVKFMAREILILRRLDHPNVIKLEGLITSQASASLYFVFEYMEHDLTGLVTLHGVKFTDPQVKCYMSQLLNGLDHCHSRNVLHRDIKGSNLLIDNNGILKIADFGSATFFNPNLTVPLTSRVVTLWYRPPELLLGATHYGVGVDLWSAGCILGELYTGKPIMPGRTEVEQLHKIFKLCGSPSDSFWKKSKLPHATAFKPQHPYVNRIVEVFKDIPRVAIELIQTLLAMDSEQRGTASLALKSEFFTTEPHACDPSSLPQYPPSKEINANLTKEKPKRDLTKQSRGQSKEKDAKKDSL